MKPPISERRETNLLDQRKSRSNDRGQILLIFAFLFPVLILFLGLGIDAGFAWIMKALLSRAVDAAALAGMRNIDLGTTQAQAIAQDAFNANFGSGFNRDTGTPVVSISVTKDANNNNVVNVSATATINTFFIKLLPGFGTMNITSSAQATQPQLIMSLMLDKSGSMNLNGGAQALPGAVTSFIGYFNNTTDQVAEVSFSSISTVDVTMRTGFQTPITNAMNAMTFGGATFSQSALSAGETQISNVHTVAGQSVVKVAVFFTDGWANTINDTLRCPANTSVNYGGCSPPEAAVNWCSGISFLSPTTGNSVTCTATTFPSQLTGTTLPLTPTSTGQTNVANDAMYRAVQVANNMRSAQGITVYAIGMGDKINDSFLQEVANDPASPTFDSTQPQGQAIFAPDASQLQSVFDTIAQKILLRISQ